MRNLDGRSKVAAVFLLAALSTLSARADPANTTARALVAAGRKMTLAWQWSRRSSQAVASGMSWAGTIEGHPVYCPPSTAPLVGKQLMGLLERFVAENPDAADKTYGFALSASLSRAFPCTPG